MIRITKEALDELIEREGQCKHWPLNAEGVLKLALDLKEAREEIVALKERIDRLHDAAIEAEELSDG